MEMIDVEKKLIDLGERLGCAEVCIENLSYRQTAIESLTQSVQDIAISLREVVLQTNANTEQLKEMKDDTKKKKLLCLVRCYWGNIGSSYNLRCCGCSLIQKY